MRNALLTFTVLGILITSATLSFAQPANDNCSSATLLTAGTSCTINGTTVSGTVQTGAWTEPTQPSCMAAAFTQTVWYYFTPTSASMDIQLTGTGFGGNGASWCPNNWAAAVYDGGAGAGACTNISSGTLVSCSTSGTIGFGDKVIVLYLTGLNTSHTYFVQVGYRTGAGCTLIPNFCISLFGQNKEKLHNCGTCASPCGASCAYASQPPYATQAQINAIITNCGQTNAIPAFEGGQTTTQCWTFTATSTSAGFQEIINSNCYPDCSTTGNISTGSWTLQSSSCGGNLSTGTLANMTTFNNYVFTIGQSYTYCLTMTLLSCCAHFSYTPFVWGAQVLPIELTDFSATPDHDIVTLKWNTSSEENNDYFSLQHSIDGEEYKEIAVIDGAGTSTHNIDYKYTDRLPSPGTNYYRLVQFDYDGTTHYSPVVSAEIISSSPAVTLTPNPALDGNNLLTVVSNADQDAAIAIINSIGQVLYTQVVTLHTGMNQFDVDATNYSAGIYNLIVFTPDGNKGITFMK